MSTLPKKALRDPRGWADDLADTLRLDDSARAELMNGVEALSIPVDRLRRLRERRGRTSREIGAIKASGGDTSLATASVREITHEIRSFETDLLARLAALAEKAASAVENASTGSAEGGAPRYFGGATTRRDRDLATSSGDLRVTLVDSDEDATEYTRYVRAHPARTAYHDLGLAELIARTNGQRSHHLLARTTDDGTVRGVLPLVRLKSALFGDFMVSMPWFNYGGPLADDDIASEALVRAAGDTARERGCSHAEIRETSPRPGWRARTDKVSMTLALPDTVEKLDRGLGSSLRAQSNKAARAGCTFRVGGIELLDEFYRVFCINMRDLGTPVQSRAFFEGLLELFGDDAFLSVVSRDGEPLAGGFLLAHGNETLEIPWASSLRRANPLGVNMLLYRRTLGEAVTRGYRHFDFGRSTAGESTWRFKKQWGAVQRQLYWHYWTDDDDDDVTGPSADSPKFRLAIAAWQRLPVALARRLGPSLVRGLP